MKKTHLALLEKVFTAEIEGLLPFQTRSTKIIKELLEDGMVEPMVEYQPGLGRLRIEGWQLTHRGRIAYCDWAASQPEEEI